MKKLTQDVLDELQSDITDEKKLTELEQAEAEADIAYKKMLEEAQKKDKPSKDEESVTQMIKEYKRTVDSIRSPTGMEQKDVDDGYALVDGIREGRITFEQGQQRMKQTMQDHSCPVDEDVADVIGTFEQADITDVVANTQVGSTPTTATGRASIRLFFIEAAVYRYIFV